MANDTSDNGFSRNRRQFTLIASGTLALAVALFAIWYLVVRTPMEVAFTGLKPADASLISEELKRQKTPYELVDDGTKILVPHDQVNAVRVAILGGDLPLKGTVGFELFSKSDMGLTEFAQKINYQRALQGELARTLMSMSDIESARVHITLPETGIFQDQHRPAKASVTLAPKDGATIDGRTIMGVQRLVSSAVEDLDAANVVVLDGAGKQLSAQATENAVDTDIGSNAVEQAYSEQIRRAVMPLVNDPAMRITVSTPAAAQTGSGADAPGNPAPVADTTAPATTAASAPRTFPLRITIALTGGPAPGLNERLVPTLQGAIGFDPALGDSLTLLRLPVVSPYQVGTPVAVAAGLPQPSDPATQGGFASWLWLVLAGVGAATVIAVLAFRLQAKREMTVTERASFAARLRELLDADERMHGGQS